MVLSFLTEYLCFVFSSFITFALFLFFALFSLSIYIYIRLVWFFLIPNKTNNNNKNETLSGHTHTYVPTYLFYQYIFRLILLVIEAGIDVDVSSLRLIGTRGVLIAIVGSCLPIFLGSLLAVFINQEGTGQDENEIVESIAAGATFGPTSVGVTLSLLCSGGLLNTPVGQLMIPAAVIDDMIALIVLSQLKALTPESDHMNIWTILIPILAATIFLVVGGWIALFWIPTNYTIMVASEYTTRTYWKNRTWFIIWFCFGINACNTLCQGILSYGILFGWLIILYKS